MEKGFKYKRIIILGGGGSGKSTLANRIGLHTGYPIYHLDCMFYDSKWKRKEKNEWENICKEFLLKDIGIIEGNYVSVLPNRIQWSDLIIFIDTSTIFQLYSYFKRIIRVNLKIEKRYGIPDKSKTKFRWSILKWICSWNKTEKKKIFILLKEAKNKKIIIIKEPRKLDIKNLLE